MSSYSTKAKKVDGNLEKLSKKKVPVNPKYAHVKSSLNTGASLSKYLEKLEDIRTNYRFQKNEIFKRMKVTTFAQLVIQVERFRQTHNASERSSPNGSVNDASGEETDRTITENETARNGKTSPAITESDYGDRPATHRSTLQGLICGVGEKDDPNATTNGAGDAAEPVDANPYLLLDCQDEDDYNKCHIVTAINFPKARLSRAQNYEVPQMYEYKNKPGRVLVVYDADEQIAIQVVTSLVERGYDNIFMLSGGLKVAYQKCPTLITGTLPKAAQNPDTARSSSSRRSGGGGSTVSEIQLDPIIRTQFSTYDIDRIEDELGLALEAGSSGRSTAASTSRSSVASSRMSVQSADRSSSAAAAGGPTSSARWK